MKPFFLSLLLFLPLSAAAQDQKVSEPAETIGGIVTELLDLISVDKGEKIDTAAVRNLFLHSARLTVLNDHNPNVTESVSLDEFLVLLADSYYEQGYMEKEINRVVDEYNGIAQVFQSFYAKDSDEIEIYGITSYQLVNSSNRWWIVSLLWTEDSNGVELPEKYAGN